MDENVNVGNEPEKRSKIPGFRSGKTWKKVVAVIGYVIIVIFLIGLFSGNDSNNNQMASSNPTNENVSASQPAEPSPPENDKYLKSGMYKIGTDISAGEYLVYPEGTGYLEVTKDSTGSFESIVTNDNFAGTRYITVSDGQYLTIRQAKMVPVAEAEPQQAQNNEYPEGMYKIGIEIPSGEYKAVSTGGAAYIEVAKDSRGSIESIISNDNFEGEKYISISDGQYIKLNGCKLVK